MKKLGLICMVRIKKYRSYKGEVGRTTPNLLERNFEATRPNQKWVTGITEFILFGERRYFSPLLDLCSRNIVSDTIYDHSVLSMVAEMLEKFFAKIPDGTNLSLHSDQGWQYQHKRYQWRLKEKGIRQRHILTAHKRRIVSIIARQRGSSDLTNIVRFDTLQLIKKGMTRMEIRKSKMVDLPRIMDLYAAARIFMKETGNSHQWGKAYPPQHMVEQDITVGKSYVCVEQERVVGVFYFACEDDPTYLTIEDGEWLNAAAPYGVVHRIATDRKSKGVGSFCLNWCFAQCGNLRIDTHRLNLPMRQALGKNGFCLCGKIYLVDGNERLAYQRVV